jgi:4-amino-4-deoxy-L-arabinose transferase-like glycosyltransferase
MSFRISLTQLSCSRVLAIAALLHLVLAVALFSAGRAGVAPSLIDRDGIMGSFAFDSYDYQRGAIELAQMLRAGNITGWATAAEPPHVKIIAAPFALLGPLFGYGTLSAEPYNLICYLAIVALVFGLGQELGGQRTGVLAAAVVALWPTFLLHTLQLLKDPLFIMAALALLLCAVTSFGRTYGRVVGATASMFSILLVLLLSLVRFSFVLLMIAIALLTLVLLIVRQAKERRLLFWNMAPALAVLLTSMLLLPFVSNQNIRRTKQFVSDQVGPLKDVADPAVQVPTTVRWLTAPEANGPANTERKHSGKFARRISSMRSRFAAAYANSGSLLDADTEFRNLSDLARYVPRAMEVGLWAPFPSTWISTGKRVGNAGKLLSGVETFVIYGLQLLALAAIVREPRRLSLWFVLAVVIAGVTALAFVIPNVGALYRFRYVFWILLIVAAMVGLNSFLAARQFQWSSLKRSTLVMSVLSAVAVMHGCASLGQSSHSQQDGRVNRMNLSVTNFTGTNLRSLYLSPTAAKRWQENVLAGAQLRDGDTLDIEFDPNEKNVEWDLRIEGTRRYAEWRNLKVSGISEITLVLKLDSGAVVVAEME